MAAEMTEEQVLLEKRLVQVIPSKRQICLQQTEFYGFFHISVNTFTGREWGDGTESPSVFHPKALDADQWVLAVKAAGMKGAILTCKHHDGFCLWPSIYTEHSVAFSPYRDGKGDVVKEAASACRRAGLKFGIYLSPWDRHEASYGTGRAYDDYFTGQLTELLTGYGDIFCVWLDGACGEGKNGSVQIYDWNRYYETIRRLQPSACISVCGPDVRWCGNEAGDTRPEEWSVVSARLADAERVKEHSQQADETGFRQKKLSSSDMDLGSRGVLAEEKELVWYPAEVDVSIRPGWFYHEEEDQSLRSLENLLSIYDQSVGGNGTLLLNVPPDKNGLIAEGDVKRLRELGEAIAARTARNLMDEGILTASPEEPGYHIEAVRKNELDHAYKTPDGVRSCEIWVRWKTPVAVKFLILKEDIRFSQRIEGFRVKDGRGTCLYEGGTVGYQKFVHLPGCEVTELCIEVTGSRAAPVVSFAGIYG